MKVSAAIITRDDAAALDQCDLLVRVFVRGRDDARREAQAADHHVLSDDHLPLGAARLEAREENGNRNLWRRIHTAISARRVPRILRQECARAVAPGSHSGRPASHSG